MNVNYRIESDILYIVIEGRVDASNANEVEQQIFAIKEAHPCKKTVLDADNLEYISSAGLRIILRLRKAEPELSIINVSPEVYEIFDMTGFTEMVNIEKAFRKINVDGCDFIAKGANGAVYRYDEETIVKVYFGEGRSSLEEIEQERTNAKMAFVKGVNTAIPYGIVKVGKYYGTITELLNAVSVSKIIKDNLDDIETPVNYFVEMIKNIHSIEVEPGELSSIKETFKSWIDFISKYIPENQSAKLYKLLEELKDRNTMLHGDYHTNNIMIQNNEAVLIDMDTLCYGHPIFELSFMYNALLGYSDVDKNNVLLFLGYPYDVAYKFWRMSLSKYLNTTDETVLNEIEEKAMLLGNVRLLRHFIRHNNETFLEERIKKSKERIATLVEKIDSLDF